ncbi:hypothetical protein BDY19DRAFT_891840 [Irpex rosettiformis]|uniref:Uncharacterized protein n=1 Tax=Irpex rosettiformis TaxID=378272 RepID=A0ACB8U128_9APHY|nr:hypothetical protein BDY19DRAFT_891840 [Irpex rosettiformis]
MSLARAALRTPRILAVSTLALRRSASTAAHDDHHDHDHHHHEDNTVYPQESFANKTWRNWALGGLAVALFYKFAPAPNDDAYLTRWISLYQIDSSLWKELKLKNLAVVAEGQIHQLVLADAKKPPVYRLRFPQKLEQHSGHLVPVGVNLDSTGVVVEVENS